MKYSAYIGFWIYKQRLTLNAVTSTSNMALELNFDPAIGVNTKLGEISYTDFFLVDLQSFYILLGKI